LHARGVFFEKGKMTNREKNVVKMEKMQQRIESGLVSEHFPGVSSIVIHVTNSYKGIIPETILRTFNFWPNSYAYFDIECLSEDCRDGGFDLSRVITMMIRNHKDAEEGELMCDSSNLSSDHSCIYYKVSILYDGTIL
jgi:hypothetical protein